MLDFFLLIRSNFWQLVQNVSCGGIPQPLCQFWCFCNFSLSNLRANTRQTHDVSYKLDLGRLRSSRMSAVQIIILHPYISLKFAYMADSPSQRWPTPPGMKTSPGPAMDYGVWTVTALSSLLALTFVLFILELVHNVGCGTNNIPANFCVSATLSLL